MRQLLTHAISLSQNFPKPLLLAVALTFTLPWFTTLCCCSFLPRGACIFLKDASTHAPSTALLGGEPEISAKLSPYLRNKKLGSFSNTHPVKVFLISVAFIWTEVLGKYHN